MDKILNIKDKKYSLLFVFFLFILSCKEKEEYLLLTSSPSELNIIAEPRTVVGIQFHASSSDKALTKFTVTKKIDAGSTNTILDLPVSGKQFSYLFQDSIPGLTKETEYFYTFTIRDAGGKTTTVLKKIVIKITDEPLTGTTGHQLFAKGTGEMDAYDVLNGTSMFSLIGDSTKMDIQDTTTTNELKRVLRSFTGGKFVRFNGFDFANATKVKLEEAYNSGAKFDLINNVQEGDIILFYSQKRNFFAAIRINQIVTGDPQKNRYIFEIKK
ncbi:MAG: hypothetical protein ACK40G_15895 [Cytophagaceae bacterium]